MNNDRPYISIVIPVFRAENILPVLCERLTASLRTLNVEYEIVLIDDRSPDNSWEVMRRMAALYPTITAVRLSRNFGQHYALTAGLDFVSGEWTVTMDCDLQDQPEEIAKLLAVAEQGNDVVLARRIDRKDRWTKRWSSRFFYQVYYLLSGHRMDPAVGCFRIMRRTVVDGYRNMPEASRHFGGMIQWLGFRTAYVDVEHAARYEGLSSYNLRALSRLAINGIVAFSNRPLYFSVAVGLTMSLFSVGFGVYVLILYLAHHAVAVPGWMSLVALTTFIGGLILLNVGILGIYIGRIYKETKGRPLYVVDQIVTKARDDAYATLGNPAQRNMFNRATNESMLAFGRQMGGHVSQQASAHKDTDKEQYTENLHRALDSWYANGKDWNKIPPELWSALNERDKGRLKDGIDPETIPAR